MLGKVGTLRVQSDCGLCIWMVYGMVVKDKVSWYAELYGSDSDSNKRIPSAPVHAEAAGLSHPHVRSLDLTTTPDKGMTRDFA